MYGDSTNIFLLNVPAHTADADAVAGPTSDVFYHDVRHLIPHGDTVISGLDVGVHDGDAVVSRDVEAISVGAFSRCYHFVSQECDIVAGDAVGVKILTVFGSDVLDYGVVDKIEAKVDGKLCAVFVDVAVVGFPGMLTHAVENTSAGEGEVAYVVDSDPFPFFVGQLRRVGKGFYGAFHFELERSFAGSRQVSLLQDPFTWTDCYFCRLR